MARGQKRGNAAPAGPFPWGTEQVDGDNRYTLLADVNNTHAPHPPALAPQQYGSWGNDNRRADTAQGRQREMTSRGRGRNVGREGRHGRGHGHGRGYDMVEGGG
jgi:hypothetical protein